MKLRGTCVIAVAALALMAGALPACAQATFKIPYQFQAADLKLPKGEYRFAPKDAGHLTLRQESTGKEFQVAFIKRLAQPNPPHHDPELVIDAVGDFVPSYTEYVTDYVLAEVWLPGGDGFLIHVMKGAHESQTIKGEKTD